FAAGEITNHLSRRTERAFPVEHGAQRANPARHRLCAQVSDNYWSEFGGHERERHWSSRQLGAHHPFALQDQRDESCVARQLAAGLSNPHWKRASVVWQRGRQLSRSCYTIDDSPIDSNRSAEPDAFCG